MFQTKKQKIIRYLESKPSAEMRTAFDGLLQDFISGALKSELESRGVASVGIHIDWLADYRCIALDGTYRGYQIEMQIEPTEFSIAYDEDEPEESETYPLVSKEAFWREVQAMLQRLN